MRDLDTEPEERLLQSLADPSPVADEGFTDQVISRVRRRLWLERLTVPVAALAGGVIAVRPVAAVSEEAAEVAASAMRQGVTLLTSGTSWPALLGAAAAVLAVAVASWSLVDA